MAFILCFLSGLFTDSQKLHKSGGPIHEGRQVEGARLAFMTCQETPQQISFHEVPQYVHQANKFAPAMALFVDRRFGLKCFKDPFPGDSSKTAV